MFAEYSRIFLGLAGFVQCLQPVSAVHPNSLEIGCFHRLDKIAHEPITSSQPPDVTGLWTSVRCETRPGPEFLLRKYKFENNSTFTAVQFYYSDPDCINPIYSVLATGTYRPVRKSWSIAGGTEVNYKLSKVSVTPYTKDMSKQLNEKVKSDCSSINYEHWQPYLQQDLYNFPLKNGHVSQETLPPPKVIDFDCTHVINFTMHELQLMRVETRLRHQHTGHRNGYNIIHGEKNLEEKVEELLLGDIHTNVKKRQSYRPSSYQVPLKKNKVTSSCGVCLRVSNADILFPPELRQRHGTTIKLTGEWVSSRCENRPPHGVFLTRRLIFAEDKTQWEGYYDFFHDPLCREKSYSVYAFGNYAPGRKSDVISGAYNYDFKVNKVKITPNDMKTTELLNAYSGKYCGVPKSWRMSEQQDVTSTNGCETLGIRLPYIEYDLIKMEYRHWKYQLLIGQRPTDGQPIKSPTRRPTSFQEPLVKCERLYIALAYTKDHERRAVDNVGSMASSTSSVYSTFVTLVLVAYLTH